MKKRLYKIYPDFKMRFTRILTTLGLTTLADGGWYAKVYEKSGPFNRWKCISKEPKEGTFFGPELVVERAHEEAKKNRGIICYYDRFHNLIEWLDYEFSVIIAVKPKKLSNLFEINGKEMCSNCYAMN